MQPQELGTLQPTLILDALIGYSLKGAPHGLVLEPIQWANGSGGPFLSLDVPSGLDVRTGIAPGEVIRPTWTLTLALPKTSLLPDRTGALYLADIGIPVSVYQKVGILFDPPFDQRYVIPLSSSASTQ